jgi:hypothetical protein
MFFYDLCNRRVIMAMNFEELDDITRHSMLAEFEAEESSGNPYRGNTLSPVGLVEFSGLMRRAILSGNEQTLTASLLDLAYWNHVDRRGYRINIQQAAERLGLTEFNTWYVRGFAKRLIDEGVTHCQVYRAAMPKGEESAECRAHEGQIYFVVDIYGGHRARYWPGQGNRSALSIPLGPNCHHTIRRVSN